MKRYTHIPKSAKKKGLQPNPDAASIQEDDWEFVKQAIRYSGYGGASNVKKGTRLLRNVEQIKKKDWTDETKADFTYNYYHFVLMTDPKSDCNSELFVVYFRRLLNWVDVPNPLGITTNRNKEPFDRLASYYSTTWFIAPPESDKHYLPPTNYLIPHEIPTCYQGQQAVLESDKSKVKARRKHFNFPMNAAEDNRNVTTTQADISNTLLTTHRNEYRTGTRKERMQTALAKMEGVDATYRRLLSIDKEFAEEIDKKYVDDPQEMFRKGCEQEKDDYKWEINFYHGEDAQELLNHQVQCLGNRPDSVTFVYDVRYTMDGYVRKAGPHYVLSAGKLLGEQTLVEGKGRRRSTNTYMSALRTFQWSITVNLPAGYEAAARGVEKLNVKAENECGTFIAKAVAQNGKPILDITKRYDHETKLTTSQGELLEIQDASKVYESLSVVLKK